MKSTLRLNNKNFEDEELQYELFLTTKQTNKIGNSIDTKMSIDIKLSKAQISKNNSIRWIFCCWSGNLGKKALTKVAIPLVRVNLSGLLSNLTSNARNKAE